VIVVLFAIITSATIAYMAYSFIPATTMLSSITQSRTISGVAWISFIPAITKSPIT
jgi:hypothetical protein